MPLTVLLAGSHGGVGQHVTTRLGESDHDDRCMIRDDAQAEIIDELGGEPIVADLTEPDSLEAAVDGCDAIIFAAGSGGNDVYGVDRDGAITLIEAAEGADVERFVMLSSMGADDPQSGPDPLEDYLIAKAEADERLRQSDLNHTIVRPGELTDEDGTGQIRVGEFDLGEGDIPREDVAEVLVESLERDGLVDETFELLGGEEPIADALESVGAA
ncbi:SDR family oxidoreductase [Natronolimnohabitans innermongolicus]|uniref:NAD-dependent epimerase/dehydratase n=1 Tax=Natronolimnohabitans innermongolicus JCM 12255 TaxID=1227499 RepID=L9XGX7_9EURY|nr:SDR family oxidoreductase [Natronolimnohabitans innermongolicus]ELY60661.1 NAD-dependent epimerase/dehydratase [Natronolimnohabitans innermongolicus JCM 12255]